MLSYITVKLKIKKFNRFTDKTGSLIPFYSNLHYSNFKLRRFFFIYGNTKHPRASHAHKKCNQILIPIKGQMITQITTKNNKKYNFNLSTKNKKFLTVPKQHWIKILFRTKNSILLTLCDYKYDQKEYIYNIGKFIR